MAFTPSRFEVPSLIHAVPFQCWPGKPTAQTWSDATPERVPPGMGGLETTVQPQEAAAAVGAPAAPGTPSAMPTVNRTAAARNDRGAGTRSPPVSDCRTILSLSGSRSPGFGPSASG